MEKELPLETTHDMKSETSSPTRNLKDQCRSRRRFINLILGGHVLAAYGFYRYKGGEIDYGSITPAPVSTDSARNAWDAEAEKQKALLRRLESEFRGVSIAAKSRNDTALARFNRETETILSADLAAANRTAEETANDIAGYKNTLYLAGILAYDKIRGTSKADEFLTGKLEPISKELVSAQIRCDTARRRFLAEIESSQNQFQAGMGQIVEGEFANEMPAEWANYYRQVIGRSIGVTEVGASRVGITAALGGAFVGLDIYLARKIFPLLIEKALQTAKKILEKIVARLAGSAAISGGAVVIDGPLPIGDIVALVLAVVSGVWSAVDIHKARKKLQQELTSVLKSSLDSSFSEMARSSQESAKEMTRKCRENNEKAVGNTLEGFTLTTDR